MINNLTLDILSKLKSGNSTGGGGSSPTEEWIGDGRTHIWVSLGEGRTSPRLGGCLNGTVTIDWGDGTTPDVLTGTSLNSIKYTPNHNYAKAGDYVITLTVDGEFLIASASTASALLTDKADIGGASAHYRQAIKKVEASNGVRIGNNAFHTCVSLKSIKLPESLTKISKYAFHSCRSLRSIDLPNGITAIDQGAFNGCYSLASVDLPDGITSISATMLSSCCCLVSVDIPDGVTSISNDAFYYCIGLASIDIPASVTSIGGMAFNSLCVSKIRFEGTTPPSVAASTTFGNLATDCIISVPIGTLGAYTTATNYPSASTYTYVEE